MKTKTQIEVEKWFLERGGKLLSQYLGWNKPIVFECPKCHYTKEYSSFNNISNNPYGPFCHECVEELRQKKVNEKVILKISAFLQENNSFLILPYPKHDKDTVHFICANCRKPSEIVSWHSFKRQRNKCFCKECQYNILSEERKYPEEKVRSWFLHRNSELVSPYQNSHSPLEFKCSLCKEVESACGFISLSKTNQECLCKKCQKEKLSASLLIPREEIEPWFKERGSEIVSYSGMMSFVVFKCSKCKKEETYQNVYSLKKDNPLCQCKECNKRTGPKHHAWREDLTEEERQRKRMSYEYREWCQNVLKKTEFKCVLSKTGGAISPHHIYSYSSFPKLRPFLWNGVCLRDEVHVQFHKEYGYGNNTYFQFQSFAQEKFNIPFYLFQSGDMIIDVVSCSENLLKKKEQYHKQGINYLVFFDYEVLNSPQIVDNLIQIKTKSNSVTKYGARDFNIRESTFLETQMFYNSSHRQGYVGSKINLALERDGEIFACMSFSPPRYTQRFQYELTRFSVKKGCIISGAFSRLFSFFIKKYQPNSIISYEDLRFSSLDPTQSVYIKSGLFKFLHQTKPNYWYSKNNITHSRIFFQKHKLKDLLDIFDPVLSEKENMLLNGYQIYSDCGNFVFVWQK